MICNVHIAKSRFCTDAICFAAIVWVVTQRCVTAQLTAANKIEPHLPTALLLGVLSFGSNKVQLVIFLIKNPL